MPGRAVGRKVRDSREARELLEAWSAAAGEPMSQWCGRRGINWYSLSAYQGWQVRGADSEPVDRAGGLVEIESTALELAGPSEARYRVRVGGYVVEVGGDFEDEPLRRLLRVVASC